MYTRVSVSQCQENINYADGTDSKCRIDYILGTSWEVAADAIILAEVANAIIHQRLAEVANNISCQQPTSNNSNSSWSLTDSEIDR